MTLVVGSVAKMPIPINLANQTVQTTDLSAILANEYIAFTLLILLFCSFCWLYGKRYLSHEAKLNL
jgi:hypothetical protein